MANPKYQGRNAPRSLAPQPAAPAHAPEAPAAVVEAVAEEAEMPEPDPASEIDAEAPAKAGADQAESGPDAPADEASPIEAAELDPEPESDTGADSATNAASEPGQPGPEVIVTVADQPADEPESGGLLRHLDRAAEEAATQGERETARVLHAVHVRLGEFANALAATDSQDLPWSLVVGLGKLRRLIH